MEENKVMIEETTDNTVEEVVDLAPVEDTNVCSDGTVLGLTETITLCAFAVVGAGTILKMGYDFGRNTVAPAVSTGIGKIRRAFKKKDKTEEEEPAVEVDPKDVTVEDAPKDEPTPKKKK